MRQTWAVDVRLGRDLNIGDNDIDFGVLRQRHMVVELDLTVFDDAFER